MSDRAPTAVSSGFPTRTVNHMQEITAIEIRVRQAAALPDLLAASVDAFELLRATARSCDDRTPELFAPFMMTADAPEARCPCPECRPPAPPWMRSPLLWQLSAAC